MSAEQRENIKRQLPTWFTIANFVVLITIVFKQAQWQESVDNRITYLEKHEQNDAIHRTFNDEIEDFVTRSEMDIHFKNIYDILNEIKIDVKSLEKK